MSSLVREAKKGDRHAMALLIDNHKHFAFNLALKIVKNEDVAKDVVQQSFLSVLENLSKFRDEAKFSTWLYRIVHNESLKHLRFQSRTSDYNQISEPAYCNDTSENDESYTQLYRSIELLREQEKSVIMLFYLAEKPIKEIEKITGLSKSNIKVLLHRGRLKLQKTLLK